MKHLYLTDTAKELESLQKYAAEIEPEFEAYLKFLEENYRVYDLPRAIVWTDYKTATERISDIPLPAYTNDYRTVMVPDVEVWKNLYREQLALYEASDSTAKIEDYYRNLSRRNVLQILGHEMVHHSELFFDEAYEDEMWFEEGMAEYISRKYFLTEQEYTAEKETNQAITELYDKRYGRLPLRAFNRDTYSRGIGHVYYAYWRSFLRIDSLAENLGGNVLAVFESYRQWYTAGRKTDLETWFTQNGG